MASNPTRLKHIKHQQLDRLRKTGNAFLAYISAEATRLAAPARVLRDRIKNLGTLSLSELSAAASLTAAGVPRMVANPDITIALVTAVTPGNINFGVRTTVAMTIAPRAATTGNVTFAATGSPGDHTGTITRASGSWATDGFAIGDFVVVLSTFSNNGRYEITGASATELTVTKMGGESAGIAANDLYAEVVTAATFYNDRVITRAADSFVTDGHAVGDRVILQLTGRTELDGFEAEIVAVAATKITLSASFPIFNHVTGGTATLTSNNVIARAAGDFAADGFLVGDTIVAGGTTGNVGRAARVRSVAALRIQTGTALDAGQVGAVRWTFEAAAGSRTLTGPATLTRSAGNWTTDGFLVGDAIRIVAADEDANVRDFRVKAVTSATVLRLESGNAVAEGPTSNVGVYRLNELFGRD